MKDLKYPDDLEGRRAYARNAYRDLMANRADYATLGHWKPVRHWIEALKPAWVLDVGTGRSGFIEWLFDQEWNERAFGIDVAPTRVKLHRPLVHRFPHQGFFRSLLGIIETSKTGYITEGSAHDLSFAANNLYDMVCSFDVLEHVFPEDVPLALHEAGRVSRRWLLFSIASFHAESRAPHYPLQPLHVSIHPLAWWVDAIETHAGAKIVKAEPRSVGEPKGMHILAELPCL